MVRRFGTFAALVALMPSVLFVSSCVDQPRPSREKTILELQKHILDALPKSVAHPLKFNFDNKVQLLGYAIDPEKGQRPGTRVKLTLYWKLTQDLAEGWSLFTHVVDATGERLLNLDNIGPLREWRGAGQAFPPGDWTVGKVYVDEQSFTIPKEANGERLDVLVGIWKGEARLKVVEGPHDAENRAKALTLNLAEPKKKKKKSTKPPKAEIPKLRVAKLPEGARLKIDGVLDEAEWRRAAASRPFVGAQSGKRDKELKLGGRVKILYDDRALYLGFNVEDADIRGGFPKNARDAKLWTMDTVEIMIDPDGDGDNNDYYEIQINPQNLVFDSHFDQYKRPQGSPDGPFGHQEWSAELKSAVTVDGTLDKAGDQDKGYVVEAAIPWKSFHKAKQIPPKPGDHWRINFFVIENNAGVAWSPVLGEGDFHRASRFGQITWSEQLLHPTRQELLRERGMAPTQNTRQQKRQQTPPLFPPLPTYGAH